MEALGPLGRFNIHFSVSPFALSSTGNNKATQVVARGEKEQGRKIDASGPRNVGSFCLILMCIWRFSLRGAVPNGLYSGYAASVGRNSRDSALMPMERARMNTRPLAIIFL